MIDCGTGEDGRRTEAEGEGRGRKQEAAAASDIMQENQLKRGGRGITTDVVHT